MTHITKTLHPILAQIALHKAIQIVLQPFSLQYRLHTNLGRETWAKLWYTCRALDQKGRGFIKFPVEMIAALTGGDEKSIYRWLKDGRRWGAFRAYSCKHGVLTIWLGSLSKTCFKLNIKNWGAVSVQNLLELRNIRALTTATLTQKLQQRSRYAANCKLKPDWRKLYGSPHPNELLGNIEQSSLKTPEGQVPCVLHISETRLFVSKGFIAFGTSQQTIAKKLGIHPVTVQRHQKTAGMISRQLCQAKSEYAWVDLSLKKEAPEFYVFKGSGDHNIGYRTVGDKVIFEDGIPKGSKHQQVNQFSAPVEEFKNRFFKLGKKYYLAKCNIYREDYELKAMYKARSEHLAKVSQCQFQEISAGARDGDCVNNLPPGGI